MSRRYVLAIGVFVALGGCGTQPVVVATPKLPASLFKCADRPVAKATDGERQDAHTLVKADAAYRDCRAKLTAAGKLVGVK